MTHRHLPEGHETPVFADIMMDWTFHKVFSKEKNKDLLRSLANCFLPEHAQVAEFELLPTDFLGSTSENKDFRVDMRCKASDGSQFIVEVQRYKQDDFFKRCVAYASAAYIDELEKGCMYSALAPVYLIALLSPEATAGVDIHKSAEPDQCVFSYELREKTTGEVPCETILINFVELERFDKRLEECQNEHDRWLYVLKNAGIMKEKPEELTDETMNRLFEELKISMFTKDEYWAYMKARFNELDAIARIETATNDGLKAGLKEGMEKGRMETARNLKSLGADIELICKSTGLTTEQVAKL